MSFTDENSRREQYYRRFLNKVSRWSCTCRTYSPRCTACSVREKLVIADNLPSFVQLWNECLTFWEDASVRGLNIRPGDECVWKLTECYEYSGFSDLVNDLGDGFLLKLLETAGYTKPVIPCQRFLIAVGKHRFTPEVKAQAGWLEKSWGTKPAEETPEHPIQSA